MNPPAYVLVEDTAACRECDGINSPGCGECNGTGRDKFPTIGKCRVCGYPLFEDEADRGDVHYNERDRPAHEVCYFGMQMDEGSDD